MLIKLKRTFVLLCTGLTGLVLLAACLLAFGSAKAEIERHYAEAFESQSQSLSVFLAGTQRLHYNQFYQMEQDGGTHVYFYDSGAPIYNAESHAESRDAVYAALVGALEKTHPGLTPASTWTRRSIPPSALNTAAQPISASMYPPQPETANGTAMPLHAPMPGNSEKYRSWHFSTSPSMRQASAYCS